MWNKILTPMLLTEEKEVFDSNNFLYELKYDGMRVLIYVSPNYIKIITRNKKDITNSFPELESIKKIVNSKCILDGEIICMDNGKISFSKLMNRLHTKNSYSINRLSVTNKATFVCFDIIYKDKDLTNLKLIERKKILNNIKDNDVFVKSFYVLKNGKKLFKSIKDMNMEGIVCKDINSKYEVGTRSKSWIKIKNFKIEKFYIGGFSYNNTNVFSVYLGEYKNKHLCYVGKVFISKKNNLFDILKNNIVSNNPFYDYNNDKIKFVKVNKTIEVKYIERTSTNHLRQPFYYK